MSKLIFLLKVTVTVLCICSCSSAKVITGEIKDVSDRVVECKGNHFLLLNSAPMPSKGQIVTFTRTSKRNLINCKKIK